MITSTLTLSYASDSYLLEVQLSTSPITVSVQNARDAYQLAVADGFVGTRAEWRASLQGETGPTGPQGPAGSNPEIVMLSPGAAGLAEYIALTPEQQMDGRWYLVPKLS